MVINQITPSKCNDAVDFNDAIPTLGMAISILKESNKLILKP